MPGLNTTSKRYESVKRLQIATKYTKENYDGCTQIEKGRRVSQIANKSKKGVEGFSFNDL